MKVIPAITQRSSRNMTGFWTIRATFWMSLSALFAMGCSSKQCLFESDCAQGLVCAESVCRQSCDEERQCPVDFSCRTGACYPSEASMCSEEMPCDMDMDLMSEVDANMQDEFDRGLNEVDGGSVVEMTDMSLSVDADLIPMDMMVDDIAVDDFPDAAVPDDSRFNLGGSYMVVHTLVFGNGGSLSEGGEERNNIQLTSISSNRYRVEVRDDLGRDILYVDSAVNFAHRDGVGYYDFQYPWNIEAGEMCTNIQIRAQEGSYRQGPRGYSMQGVENRTTCTCYPEPVNARVPVLDPSLCTGEYYQQVFNVEWIPWN